MHHVTFFPIGNADSCFIKLENGRSIVFDFADKRSRTDPTDKRVDLEAEVRRRVGDAKRVSVLALSHLDEDHIKRVTEVFWLDHAWKYQSPDRIKIDTLWVPAAAILEEGLDDEAGILRREAQHRLREGKGIRVFSRPEAVDDWLVKRGIPPSTRWHLISDAGTLCPEFTLIDDGVEFFVHSPFAEHCADGSLVMRNDAALFMQATFEVYGQKTRLILSADVRHEVIEDIVRLTRYHGNDDRLLWDVNNIPHHCSYLSLADEKGKDETVPSAGLKWLYEAQGRANGLIVSTSTGIPAGDTFQPPHRQAANYYRRVAGQLGGSFVVTMDHPTASAPKPMEIEIGRRGFTLRKLAAPAVATVVGAASPRAG